MKFAALLKKELRESLPFIITAAVLLLLIGALCLKFIEPQVYQYNYRHFEPATEISSYELYKRSALSNVGPFLWLLSIALGIAIGIRQFWVAFFSRTWDFEICRPTKRAKVLTAKITAAVIGFIISVGLVWLLLYWYASLPGVWFTPPADRIFIEGWLLIALGFVAYLGIALAGLSTERWYTTRLFSLGLVIFVFIACFCDSRLWLIFIFLLIGILVLLVQITEKFLNRQF